MNSDELNPRVRCAFGNVLIEYACLKYVFNLEHNLFDISPTFLTETVQKKKREVVEILKSLKWMAMIDNN